MALLEVHGVVLIHLMGLLRRGLSEKLLLGGLMLLLLQERIVVGMHLALGGD